MAQTILGLFLLTNFWQTQGFAESATQGYVINATHSNPTIDCSHIPYGFKNPDGLADIPFAFKLVGFRGPIRESATEIEFDYGIEDGMCHDGKYENIYRIHKVVPLLSNINRFSNKNTEKLIKMYSGGKYILDANPDPQSNIAYAHSYTFVISKIFLNEILKEKNSIKVYLRIYYIEQMNASRNGLPSPISITITIEKTKPDGPIQINVERSFE